MEIPISAFSTWCFRLGEGRDLATRKKAGQHVFEALSAYLDPVFAQRKFALSFRYADQRQGNELEAQTTSTKLLKAKL